MTADILFFLPKTKRQKYEMNWTTINKYLHSSCCFGLGTTMAMIIMTAMIETVVPAIILALVEDKKLIVNWSNDHYSVIYTKNYKL